MVVGIIGVALIAYVLGTKAGQSSGGTQAVAAPTTAADNGASQSAPEDNVPRISLDEFTTLYGSFSSRPYIVDVRVKDSYDEGHIKGAVSIPEAEMSNRIGELPKDKLIVAYCA